MQGRSPIPSRGAAGIRAIMQTVCPRRPVTRRRGGVLGDEPLLHGDAGGVGQ